ncbi:MAG: flippase-like domain-containing protein [Clostridia bacterium]|nr:flippase-like domain-containing protein [Clostridia bacterium]
MKKVSKNVKKQILNISFVLLLVGITLAVLLTSNKELNFKDIFSFIKSSNPWLLAASVLCMIAGIIFEGLCIHIISRKFGHKGKLVSSIAYSSADIYYSAITPSATGGQPASIYYMVKDGMGAGTASFTLLVNAIAYTAALLILSALAFIIRPAMFAGFEPMVKFFVIFGMSVQTLLLGLFIACMFCSRAVLKLGNGLITLLTKMRIVKKPDKWRRKVSDEVEKYRNCARTIRKHRLLFLNAILLTLAQRVVRVIISCCICIAAEPDTSFWDVFVIQSFVIVGYTFLPVPGGVGAFEYLYLHTYRLIYNSDAFIFSAMMVMRTVSYYLSIIVSGIMTLSYHVYLMRRKKPQSAALPLQSVNSRRQRRMRLKRKAQRKARLNRSGK